MSYTATGVASTHALVISGTSTLILFLFCSVPKEMLLPLSLLADHLTTGSVEDNAVAVSITVS